jgi:hypothetical protein
MSIEDAANHGAGLSTVPAFELLPERPPRIRYYALQLFLVPFFMIVWNVFIEEVTGWSELHGSPMGNNWYQVIKGVEVGAVGLFLGFLFYRIFPELRETGRWIWIFPVSLLALGILYDLHAVTHPRIFEGYFYWSHPGRDEGALGREFFTYPAWTSIWYSVGMVIAARTMPKRAQAGAKQSA